MEETTDPLDLRGKTRKAIEGAFPHYIRIGGRIEEGRVSRFHSLRPVDSAAIETFKSKYGVPVFLERSYQVADFYSGRASVSEQTIEEFRRLRDIDIDHWEKYRNVLVRSSLLQKTGASDYIMDNKINYRDIVGGLFSDAKGMFFMRSHTIGQIPVGIICHQTQTFPQRIEVLNEICESLGLKGAEQSINDLTNPEIDLLSIGQRSGIAINRDMWYRVDPKHIEEMFQSHSKKIPILQEVATFIGKKGLCMEDDIHESMKKMAGIHDQSMRNEILSILQTANIITKYTRSDIGNFFMTGQRKYDPLANITPINLAATAKRYGSVGEALLYSLKENIGGTINVKDIFLTPSISSACPPTYNLKDFKVLTRKFVRALDIQNPEDVVVVKGNDIKTAVSIYEAIPRSEIAIRLNKYPQITIIGVRDSHEMLIEEWNQNYGQGK